MKLSQLVALVIPLLTSATSLAGTSYVLTGTGTLGAGLPDALGIDGATYALSVQFGDQGANVPWAYESDGYYSLGTKYPVELVTLTLSNASNPLNNRTFTGTTEGFVEFYTGNDYGTYGGAFYQSTQNFGFDGATATNGYLTELSIQMPVSKPAGLEVPVMPSLAGVTYSGFQAYCFPTGGQTMFSYNDQTSSASLSAVPEPTIVAAALLIVAFPLRRRLI